MGFFYREKPGGPWKELPMIKGDKGDPFTYEDFTEEQLNKIIDGVVKALPIYEGEVETV